MAAINYIDSKTTIKMEDKEIKVSNVIHKIYFSGMLVEIKESVTTKIPYFKTMISNRFPTVKNSNGDFILNNFNGEIIKVIIQCVESSRFTDLFTLLPRNENVVNLLKTIRILGLELPFQIYKSVIHFTHEISLPDENESKSTSFIIHEFAFNLYHFFHVKNEKADKEDRNKLFYFAMLHLLIRDTDVNLNQKQHLQKLCLQVLPSLTLKQKKQMETIDMSLVVDKTIIKAVKCFWDGGLECFLWVIGEDDNALEYFCLIDYLKLPLPFPTTQAYIKTYLSTSSNVKLEGDTISKLAYLLFINKNPLTLTMMNNVAEKACVIMRSVDKEDTHLLLNAEHIQTIIKFKYPAMVVLHLPRMGDCWNECMKNVCENAKKEHEDNESESDV